MNINPKRNVVLLFISALLLGSLSMLQAADSSAYTSDNLTIKEVTTAKNGTVRIAFTTMPETLWYCPGANCKKTDKGLHLTFVRANFKKRPKVDLRVTFKDQAKSIIRYITIPAESGPIFYHDGDRLVQLHPKKTE